MRRAQIFAHARGIVRKTVEGAYRGPAVGYSHWGNAFEVPFGDGYQAGLSLVSAPYAARGIPIAFSCVMLAAKAMALCPASHQVLVDGQWVKSTTSPASRLLRYPNAYQTWAQFILNAVATMQFEGEAFAEIERDDRFAPKAFHLLPRRGASPYVDPSDGEIFYSIGANPMRPVPDSNMLPQRDVIHFRQYTPRHPLIGETALKAAALALGVNVALAEQSGRVFQKHVTPERHLDDRPDANPRQQIQELRAAFDDQAAGLNAGKDSNSCGRSDVQPDVDQRRRTRS